VETLFLMIDTVGMLLVLIYSMKNDKLKPGSTEVGLFRMSATKTRLQKQPNARQARGRVL